MNPVVLVSHHTTGTQRDAVDAACARAGVSCIRWRAGDARVSTPLLFVSGLGVGERQIPSDVVELVDGAGADAPLLLLTSETLVRPSVALQEGRVVVVGEAHRAERLYGHVRMLAGAATNPGESLRPRWFCAEVAPAAPVADVSGEALTAVLALTDDEIAPADRSAAIARVSSATADGTELSAVLGDRAGVVHLTADASRWLVSWPGGASPRGSLYLYSPTRLPSLFDLRTAAGSMHPQVLALEAGSGDTLLAMSTALACPEEEISRMMCDGGPVLLQRVKETAGGGASSGLVVELR